MGIKTVRKPRQLIGLTPLIDVVFILLVFFMITSNYQQWRQLPLHSTVAGSAGETPKTVLFVVQPDALLLEGETVTTEVLTAYIQRNVGLMPDLHILLQPGDGVILQRMVEVLDQVAAAGGRSVSITH